MIKLENKAEAIYNFIASIQWTDVETVYKEVLEECSKLYHSDIFLHLKWDDLLSENNSDRKLSKPCIRERPKEYTKEKETIDESNIYFSMELK